MYEKKFLVREDGTKIEIIHDPNVRDNVYCLNTDNIVFRELYEKKITEWPWYISVCLWFVPLRGDWRTGMLYKAFRNKIYVLKEGVCKQS